MCLKCPRCEVSMEHLGDNYNFNEVFYDGVSDWTRGYIDRRVGQQFDIYYCRLCDTHYFAEKGEPHRVAGLGMTGYSR